MIPKVIHYCWFGGKKLPKDVEYCIKSWKKMCPDYKIVRWDESNFDIRCHPFVKQAYEMKSWAFVSDYARLKVIYENGGIYLDTDVELIKSLDELLENECYFGIQQAGKFVATGLGFGSIKGHTAVKAMLEQYNGVTFTKNDIQKLACPYLNTKTLEELGYCYSDDINYFLDIAIYPPKYFDPYGTGRMENLLTETTISIHHYSATWTTWRQRVKRKIVRIIGQERAHHIKRIFNI